MSYKEIDYGSYESPSSIILGMVTEGIIADSGDNRADDDYGDNDLGDI